MFPNSKRVEGRSTDPRSRISLIDDGVVTTATGEDKPVLTVPAEVSAPVLPMVKIETFAPPEFTT